LSPAKKLDRLPGRPQVFIQQVVSDWSHCHGACRSQSQIPPGVTSTSTVTYWQRWGPKERRRFGKRERESTMGMDTAPTVGAGCNEYHARSRLILYLGPGGTLRLCSAVLTVVLLEEFGSLTDWASAGLEIVRCCSRCRYRFEPEPGSGAACLSCLGLALAVACRRCGLDDNDDGSDHDNAAFEAFEFAVGDAGWLCFPCPVHVPCPCPCPCPCFRSALVPSLSSRFGEHGW
jgi:hypothetical protein